MKYVAIISSAHKRVVDPFIQETYEKFKQFIPKGFEHLVKYDYCLEIPLYYESPEYYELIDYLNQHNEKPQVPMLYTSYTKSELNKAEFFRLAPSYPLELEGKFSRDYGTKHRDQCNKDYFCLMCGELIGDVFVDRKFMKKKKFGCLVPDLFASEELKEAIEEAGLTGIEFGGLVKDYKGREMKEKYYVVNITSILPPLSDKTWIESVPSSKCEHVCRYLWSDLMYEREKLAQAKDFNLTCEHLNNWFLQKVVASARAKKALSQFRLWFCEPVILL